MCPYSADSTRSQRRFGEIRPNQTRWAALETGLNKLKQTETNHFLLSFRGRPGIERTISFSRISSGCGDPPAGLGIPSGPSESPGLFTSKMARSRR